MTSDFHLLGASPTLQYIVMLLAAPVVIVLLWFTFRLATTAHQRLTILVCGGLGAIAAPIALALVSDPAPNSWYENTFAFFVVAAMVAGAALGISVCALFRYLLTRVRFDRDGS